MGTFTWTCARTYNFAHLSRTIIRYSMNVVRCVVKKGPLSIAPSLCCRGLQCGAVCCSVLQCVAVRCSTSGVRWQGVPQYQVCERCSVLQCVAVCCSVLQCVAVPLGQDSKECQHARCVFRAPAWPKAQNHPILNVCVYNIYICI